MAARHEAKKDLADAPMITEGAIAQEMETGEGAVQGTARRLGIKPVRAPNNRKKYSYRQVEAICNEMRKQNA